MSLARDLATRLGLTDRYVLNTSQNASHRYRTFRIRKRQGGYREINQPSRELKALQRGLVRFFVSRWQVHDAATAYRRGKSILDNATAHVNSNYLLRLDLRRFFPSITRDDICAYLARVEPRWDDNDKNLFVRLVCLNGRLTIGAPSSPSISNAICYELDQGLSEISEALDIVYTRYADDLFFSTDHANVLRQVPPRVQEVLRDLGTPANLEINLDKTRHSSRRGCRRVTGLTLGPDRHVYVGRHLKRKVRAQIHTWGRLSGAERRQLAGTLAYMRSIDPDFINALVVKYGPEAVQRATFL